MVLATTDSLAPKTGELPPEMGRPPPGGEEAEVVVYQPRGVGLMHTRHKPSNPHYTHGKAKRRKYWLLRESTRLRRRSAGIGTCCELPFWTLDGLPSSSAPYAGRCDRNRSGGRGGRCTANAAANRAARSYCGVLRP